MSNSQKTKSASLKPFDVLKCEIGQWASENFDVHIPQLGIAEEAGEIAHVILKRAQGIRSQDEADLIDSLADCCIYALHFCYINNYDYEASRHLDMETEYDFLGALFRASGNLIIAVKRWPRWHTERSLHDIFGALQHLCGHYNFDLLQITNQTWAEVSKRNWRKYPHDGTSK